MPSDRIPTNESERALADLRARALAGGPIADGIRPSGAPFPVATGETGYYGTPLLKKPVWTWEVPAYFFVGGAAGAAAIIGAAATWSGRRDGLGRSARRLAVLGAGASACLLTMDLGRRPRFIYMLRVFKPQSAMSVGSWTLAAFSVASGAAALVDLAPDTLREHMAERLSSLGLGTLTAALGAEMATYTGVLLGATAVPAWNEHVDVLPAHFAASGVAAAAALLTVAGHVDRTLNHLGLGAAAVETLVGAAIEARSGAGSQPLKEGLSGAIVRAGGVLSGPVPLVCRAFGQNRRGWRRWASLAAIAGSILTRFGWIAAGRRSSEKHA
jgi:hypothetical protein